MCVKKTNEFTGIPFALATDGAAALRISDVRLVSAGEGGAVCP